jgi:hypothetical protein
VALIGAQAEAQSFLRTTVEGQPDLPLFWTTRCMEYRVGIQGSPTTPGRTEDAAIDAAVASWQHAANSCGNGWQFVRGAPVPVAEYHLGPVKGTPPQVQILFRELSCEDVVPDGDDCEADPRTAHTLCANKYQCMFGDDPTVIGLTTVTYSPKTGEIIDADIELNAAPVYKLNLPGKLFTAVDGPKCTGAEPVPGTCVEYDIQNTLTHELGHALGFDHVMNPASTMFASADIGEVSKRIIDSGTLRGFCTVYGKMKDGECVASSEQPLQPPAPVTGGCSAAPPSPLLLALLMGPLARRRRRPGDSVVQTP